MGKLYEMKNAPVFLEEGGLYMTSDFGYRIDPITGVGNSAHKGFDCVRWTGYMNVATIVAFESGTVNAVYREVKGVDTKYPANSAGNYVCIKHENGYVTKYFHLAYNTIPSNIKVGAKVTKGQVIGYMGTTGNSTGAHLHFQLEKDGVPIDPKPFLIDGKKFVEETITIMQPNINPNTEEEDMDVKRFEELWLEMRKMLQDNDAGEWSEAARAWATSSGLISGGDIMPDGSPNCMWADFLTREQLVVVLYRFAQLMGRV